jgi:type I restriction enzyme, S subunit
MTASQRVRLGDVCAQEREAIKPGECPDLRYIGLESIEVGTGQFVEGELSKTPEEPRAISFRFTSDHVLYGKLRPYLNKVALPDFAGKCSTEIVPLRPGPRIERSYAAYFLRTGHTVSQINARTAGARMPRADMDMVLGLELWLPSMTEQRQIIDILSRAECIVHLRREAQKKAAELIPALFLDMFGDPAANSKGWRIEKFANIAAKERHSIKAGPFGSALKKEVYVPSGYKIYGQEQVIRDDLTYGDYYISAEKFRELESCRIQAHDLLISLVGTFGRISVVPEQFEPGIINPRLMKITMDRAKVLPLFMKGLLTSKAMRERIWSVSHGGTMRIVNVGIMKALDVPIPPIEMQAAFERAYLDARSIEALQSDASTKADEAFDALLTCTFAAQENR